MNDIELLKANLNAEKVFYNLRWHELIPEEESSDNTLEDTKRNDSLNGHHTNRSKKTSSYNSIKSKNSRPSRNSCDISSPKKAIVCGSQKTKINSTDDTSNKNNDKNRLSPKSRLTFSLLDILNKCTYSQNCCCSNKGKNRFMYIEEVEEKCDAIQIDFKPPVDILYSEEKVVLFFLVSGKVKHLQVAFDKSSDCLTVSGTKLLYDHSAKKKFISHEIQSGYFNRKFLLKKPVFEEEIIYNRENGVIKIVIPLRKDE